MRLDPPPICGVCHTLAHQPREDCPEPFVCLSGPGCPVCEPVRV